jgi:hypothetical protein
VARFNEMTKEEARAFIRKVMGPERRTVEGVEKEHLLTVFRLIEPISSSNNQRSMTDIYAHADKVYHVTYFEGDTEVEELIEDDI